jgi:glycosyltransferase involved in cell wall biosynthesis
MNVCMFVYNACVADVRVMKEARTLAAFGHNVTVVALLEEGLEPVERRDGFRIVRIDRDPVHRRLARGLRRPARAGRSGEARAAPAEAGQSRRGSGLGRRAPRWAVGLHRLLMLLDYYRQAYRWTRGERFDRLHAHDLLTLPVGVVAAARSGAPLVYDAHELYPEVSTLTRRERWAWTLVERRLIGRADAILTVCESIAQELRRRHGVAATVVLNVPPYREPPPARAGVLRRRAAVDDGDAPLILYTGGFAPHRGLEHLVRAAAGFDEGVLVMMGWGRMEAELRALAHALGVSERVRITGPVSQAELQTYTADADLGVIPYEPVGLNNLYSTPNKLFELIAAGVPIVCSRLPELERFVEGEQLGLVVEPGSPAAITTAVNRLLADASLRESMRERALAASRRLCWERESTKLAALYPPSLASASASPGARAGAL